MTSTLKSILDSWDEDIHAAHQMRVHLSQMGLTDEHLPSSSAMRAGCLALQSAESIDRLRDSLVSHERDLVDQGVLHASQKVENMKGGSIVVLNHAIDKLHIISEQIDAMLERAYSFHPTEQEVQGQPVLKTGFDRIEGHKYQLTDIQIRLKDVDRLLIYANSQDAPRVLLFPPELVRITLPITEGELLLYAENMIGASAKWLQLSEVKYV